MKTPITLYKQPLTAEQLKKLRELRAAKPQKVKPSIPESLERAFLDDPLFVGLLIFLNCTAFLILIHLLF